MLSSSGEQIHCLSMVVSLASFSLLVLADLHSLMENDVTVIAMGILGMIWAGPLTTLAGACRYPSFQLWMPFFGGPRFVILQSLGWFLYSSCLTCSIIVLFNVQAAKSLEGTLSALGLLGFASTLLLNISVSLYDGDSESHPPDMALPSIIGLRVIWNAHSIVSVLVTLGGFLCFVIADACRWHFNANPLMRIGAVAFCVSSVITHFFNGPSELHNYRTFQPFQGGWSFVTLQGFGWMFLGVVIQCVIALPPDPSVIIFDGLLSMCGVVGLFSQIMLIASLSHFQERQTVTKVCSTRFGERVRISAQMFFCLMLMIWPTIILAGAYLLQKAYPVLDQSLDISTLVFAAYPMLCVSGPLSHAAGGTMHRNYHLWQPFEGGMVYIVTQAFGWMLFSVSLTLGSVYLFNHHRNVELEAALRFLPINFLSQLIVWISVLYFDPESARKTSKAGATSKASNERLAAVVLSLCGCLMCIFADHTEMNEFKVVYIRPIIICSSFLTLMSCAVAHIAGMRMFSSFRIWQPFRGGKKFVLMQVCGWTSVGFWILIMLIVGVSNSPAYTLFGLLSFLGVWGFVNCVFLIYSQNFYTDISTAGPGFSIQIKVRNNGVLKPRSSKLMKVADQVRAFAVEALQRDPKAQTTAQLLRALASELEASTQRPVEAYAHDFDLLGMNAEQGVNVLFSVFSILMFVAADILRGSGNLMGSLSSAEVPFIIGCVSGLFSIAWSHFLLGPSRSPENYKMFMPFEGGFRFVTLQALGWALFGLSVVACSTCFFVGIRSIPIKGVVTAVGINFFVCQLLLFVSVFLFDPFWKQAKKGKETVESAKVGDQKEQRPPEMLPPLTFSSGKDTYYGASQSKNLPINTACGGFFSILIGMGSLGCFMGADIATAVFGAEFPVLPARICAVAAVFASVPLTWSLTINGIHKRARKTPELMPKGGFMTLQLLGWGLWSFTVLIGILFCYGVIQDHASIRLGKSSMGGTLTGISAITAQLLVLISLEGSHMDGWSVNKRSKGKRSSTLLEYLVQNFQGVRKVSVFTRIETILKGTGHYSRLSVARQMLWAGGIITLYALHERGFDHSHANLWKYSMRWLSSPFTLAAIVLLTLVPVAFEIFCTWLYRLRAVGIYLLNELAFSLGTLCVVPAIRRFLDWPMYYYAQWWRNRSIAQDGKRTLANLVMERRVRYGSHKNEVLDVIWPTGESLERKRVEPKGSILYAHGGGWICCNSEVLLHSMTPLAREGFVLYSIDYPLSPEARYPTAVVSVLKALHWMKMRDGVTDVFLLGDSAGGNLVTMAAAIAQNRNMLVQLSKTLAEPIDFLSLPRVVRVCSVYGVLDQHSWRDTWTGYAVDFCLSCYKPEAVRGAYSKNQITSRVTISDCTKEELKSYPETLLICGTEDGLLASSRRAHKHLKDLGHCTFLKEYPGIHGFLGFPIQWTFGLWKTNATPATEDIVAFFTAGGKQIDGPHRPKYSRTDVSFDWSVVAVSFLLLAASILSLFIVNGAMQWIFQVVIHGSSGQLKSMLLPAIVNLLF